MLMKCDEAYLNFKTKCFIVLLFQCNCGPVQKRKKHRYFSNRFLYTLSIKKHFKTRKNKLFTYLYAITVN